MKTNWNLCYPLLLFVVLCLVKDCTCEDEDQQTVVKEVSSSVVKKDNPLWHFEIRNGVSNPERQLLNRYLAEKSSDIEKRFLSNYLGSAPLDSNAFEETLNPLAKRNWENRLQKRRNTPYGAMVELKSPRNLEKRLWKGLVPANCNKECESSTENRLLRIWKGIMGMEDEESSDQELETEKRILEDAEREEDKRMWKNIMGYHHMNGNLQNVFEDYENL